MRSGAVRSGAVYSAVRPLVLALLCFGVLGCSSRFREQVPPPRTPLVATAAGAIPDPPPPSRAPRPSLEPLERRVLDNGLTVWLAPRPAAPAVNVTYVSRAAARRDGRVFRGLTQVMAHALLRATIVGGRVEADYPRQHGFSPTVRALPSGTVVRHRFLPGDLERYLPILATAVRSPAYREQDLARVRADRSDDIRSTRQTTSAMIERWVDRTLYDAEDRRSRDEDGGLRGVERSTRRLVRWRHAQTFVPGQSALIVTGAFDPARAWPVIEAAFGGWEGDSEDPELAPAAYGTPDPRVLGVLAGSEQTHIWVYERAPAWGTPDHEAFAVLERILGGMFTARLNMDIRERRGASYGFSASYVANPAEGELRLATSVEPGQTRHVLGSIVRELERVRGEHGGVSATELDRARALAREARLAELDTTDGLAALLARSFRASRGPEDVERSLERLEALDVEALHAAARRWIRPDRAPIVVLGDAQRITVELRFSGLGGIETRFARGGHRSQ